MRLEIGPTTSPAPRTVAVASERLEPTKSGMTNCSVAGGALTSTPTAGLETCCASGVGLCAMICSGGGIGGGKLRHRSQLQAAATKVQLGRAGRLPQQAGNFGLLRAETFGHAQAEPGANARAGGGKLRNNPALRDLAL